MTKTTTTIKKLKKAAARTGISPYTAADSDLWSLVQDLVCLTDGVLDQVQSKYDLVSVYPDQADLDAFTDFGRDALDAVQDALHLVKSIAYVKSGDADKDDLLYGYGGLYGDR